MFDYQAGEKFKLTLIMVGFAGLMAGMFFTLLLMPTPEPASAKHKQRPKHADDPDVTGRPRLRQPIMAAQMAANPSGMVGSNGAAMAEQSQYNPVDQTASMNLIENWLPYAWDMSAQTARGSQEKAIQYMTPECAMAYRQNVWSDDIAKQIEASGLQSQFQPTVVKSGGLQADGSLLVFVEGRQVLTVPGKGDRVRAVKLEYLIKQTPAGIRIAGISESGKSG